MKTQKRSIATILAAVLALSLLLTACGNGGDIPTGDNTTPGTSSTPGVSETPDNTPGTSEPTDESDPTPGETAEPTTRPTRPDVTLEYDDEKKAHVDEEFTRAQNVCDKNGISIDLDDTIKRAFDDYWEFFDERITYEAVRTALSLWIPGRHLMGIGRDVKNLDVNNISLIDTSSFEKASDFVVSNGGTALDIKDPVQNIAAWAIASSLFYQTNCDDLNDPIWDLGCSLGFGLNNGEPSLFEVVFKENYYVIVE